MYDFVASTALKNVAAAATAAAAAADESCGCCSWFNSCFFAVAAGVAGVASLLV